MIGMSVNVGSQEILLVFIMSLKFINFKIFIIFFIGSFDQLNNLLHLDT